MQQTRFMGDLYKRLVMKSQDHLEETTKMNLNQQDIKVLMGIEWHSVESHGEVM